MFQAAALAIHGDEVIGQKSVPMEAMVGDLGMDEFAEGEGFEGSA